MNEIGLALWGLAGAFVYGAPRLVVALTQSTEPRWAPWAEFMVALSIGPIAAAGFGDLVAHWLNLTGAANQRALAVVIGLVANPAAPTVVRVVTSQLVRRLDAGSGGPASAKAKEPETK